MSSTRHKWGERDEISPHKTENACGRCGVVKVSRHEFEDGRQCRKRSRRKHPTRCNRRCRRSLSEVQRQRLVGAEFFAASRFRQAAAALEQQQELVLIAHQHSAAGLVGMILIRFRPDERGRIGLKTPGLRDRIGERHIDLDAHDLAGLDRDRLGFDRMQRKGVRARNPQEQPRIRQYPMFDLQRADLRPVPRRWSADLPAAGRLGIRCTYRGGDPTAYVPY